MKTKKVVNKVFDIPQWHGCDCHLCDGERAGNPDALLPSGKWCAGCGHGYLNVGDGGMCGRCGSREWLYDQRPSLPRYERPRSTRWTLKTQRTATVVETLTVESLTPISEPEAREAANKAAAGVTVKCDDATVTNEQWRLVDSATSGAGR